MMKKFTYLTVVLMIGFMLIGCAASTAEQRGGGSDLSSSVGNSSFVGEHSSHSQLRDLSGWNQMSAR
jgi:hypothetical protein